MLPQVTVSDLAARNELHFAKGVYNILDCGVRTGKTYWATHKLQQYTRDGHLNRILFLVNTTMLKEQILRDYADVCCNADELWEQTERSWGETINKIGVMCYQRLGSQFMQEHTAFLEQLDVICWDECDSIFDFAVEAFAKARRTDFARKTMSNAEVLAAIQQYSTKPEYMPLVLLGSWEKLVRESNILCIGLSATPERALQYYNIFISTSYKGKIEAGYRAAEAIYFTDISQHLATLQPQPGIGYWCYSPRIAINKSLVQQMQSQGFNAIELHSTNNTDYPMTPEQLRVQQYINSTHYVPPEYDFVIINAVGKTGITIDDPRFTQVIINSLRREEREQAARQTFPYQVHQKVWMAAIPDNYLNTWLTVDQCRDLAEDMAVQDLTRGQNRRQARILTWNSLKEYLPAFGYTVEQKRKRLEGKQQTCYYITGEWCDVVPPDQAFDTLVAAHQELQIAAGDGEED